MLNKNCSVCSSPMKPLFKATVLKKYEIKYFVCDNCGYICTEDPYWLNEAYSSAIAKTDIGLVSRNVHNAERLSRILSILYPSFKNKILDFGGGYGMLCRLMRDNGFDCYWTDKYCKNLFAQHFEGREERYPVVTAFELMEHTINPLEQVRDIIRMYTPEMFIFSTEIYNQRIPPSPDWWYYAFETGQHIAFFQPRTLAVIAQSCGMNYMQLSKDLHIFSKTDINNYKKYLIKSKYVQKLFIYLKNIFLKKESFLMTDYKEIQR